MTSSWEILEKRVASDVQGKRSVKSGACDHHKYDVIDASGYLYIECKYRRNPSIEAEWLEKNRRCLSLDCSIKDPYHTLPILIFQCPQIIDKNLEYIALIPSMRLELIMTTLNTSNPFFSDNITRKAINKSGTVFDKKGNLYQAIISDGVFYVVYSCSQFKSLAKSIRIASK